jgi:uncharacterized sodium:solute symporter family permease YidK
MVIGGLILTIISFNKIGGYESLRKKFSYSISVDELYSNKTCLAPPINSWNLVRNAKSDLPWPGVFIGLTVISIWYWCTDQVIAQRTLASKNITQLKLGVILCGYLKLLPLFIIGTLLFFLFVGKFSISNFCYSFPWYDFKSFV